MPGRGAGPNEPGQETRPSTQRVWSGSPWEPIVGFCRAVRVGDRIWIAGTAPFAPDGSVACPGDPAGQAARCLEIIGEALAALGAGLQHVVATRMYVTDMSRAAEVGEAHRRAFGAHPPAATLVQVAGLVHPSLMVEIEAEAVVRDG